MSGFVGREKWKRFSEQLTHVFHLQATLHWNYRKEIGQPLFYLQITYVKMNSYLNSHIHSHYTNKKIYTIRKSFSTFLMLIFIYVRARIRPEATLCHQKEEHDNYKKLNNFYFFNPVLIQSATIATFCLYNNFRFSGSPPNQRLPLALDVKAVLISFLYSILC